MTSILSAACFTLVLLHVRDCSAFPFIHDQSDTALRPVVTQSQKHRICTELCSSGLGGTPCGSDCVDLVPDSVPLVTGESKANVTQPEGYNVSTRQDSCAVLCENGLGYPLCSCQYDSSKTYDPDYVTICSTFCISYNYQIWGCQECAVYIDHQKSEQNVNHKDRKVVWEDWCMSECKSGVDVGPACDCAKYTN